MSIASDIAEPGLQADQRLLDHAWLRIGVGLAVVGQAMVFSLAVNLTPPEGPAYWILHGGLMLSAAGVLVFLGGDLVGSAVASLRQRRISIDLLFLVTLAGAFGGSLVATFTHTGSVYYEVVAILIVVHTAGKMLGARSRVAALRAVDQTRERFDVCDVRRADGSRDPPGGARPRGGRRGDRGAGRPDLRRRRDRGGPGLRAGNLDDRRVAARAARPGRPRAGGNVLGRRQLRAPARGGPAAARRGAGGGGRARGCAPSELQRQADRFVAWFLPVVAGVSLATFAFWILRAPWDRALFNAMAVLLVACPVRGGTGDAGGGVGRAGAAGLVRPRGAHRRFSRRARPLRLRVPRQNRDAFHGDARGARLADGTRRSAGARPGSGPPWPPPRRVWRTRSPPPSGWNVT